MEVGEHLLIYNLHKYLSVLSAGYHTIHWQVLGVHDNSAETGEAHLAQQHSEDNGNVVVYSG